MAWRIFTLLCNHHHLPSSKLFHLPQLKLYPFPNSTTSLPPAPGNTHFSLLWIFVPKIWSSEFPAAAAKSLQTCPTLCDPIDGSPPGTSVPGILQARTLEWVVSSFSNAWKWKAKVKSLSRVRLSATPWTAAHQAPPSMGFSRQEYWSGLPLPSPNKWADTVNLWWYMMPFQIS